jgi:hypothetical protein
MLSLLFPEKSPCYGAPIISNRKPAGSPGMCRAMMNSNSLKILLSLAVGLVGTLLMMSLAGCRQTNNGAKGNLPLLTGRAVLAADTFSPGPATGRDLHDPDLLRPAPFDSVPVQGFSSLVRQADGSLLALSDNGFGIRENSTDYPLRWYRLTLDLESNRPHGGPVTIEESVTLRDPRGLVPFPLCRPDSSRTLHGGDFDPEAMVRMDDGTFWIGEEFGPFLLHFSAEGELLSLPVPVPVTPPLRPYGQGSYFLRTPDHPDLRDPALGQANTAQANLPGSGGIEGLARNTSGSLIYVAIEKALTADPDQTRRSILEFDPQKGGFTGRFWFYRTDRAQAGITALEMIDRQRLLVVERDSYEGERAALKRVHLVDLVSTDGDYLLGKDLVLDLLAIRDNLGFSMAEVGAVGLGSQYSFPYVTPESLLILDERTLLLVNDNNYPFSQGRRPGQPDDNEFIRVQLNRSLKP